MSDRGELSVQEALAPKSVCFGCGPQNALGLRIRSFETPEGLVCDFVPSPHHHAFPGVLNGGIIGSLLDCHSNWAAAMALYRAAGSATLPCTVTADFHVKLRRPTPLGPVKLLATIETLEADRALVVATLTADGRVTATCRGTFVAVGPDHPAYHRW